MNKLNQCPYCGGIAKGCIKTVESFKKIHNYYVVCTECGASTERYNTEFSILQEGKFHVLTKKEAINHAVCDWNNGIFDTQTKLFHMTDQEKLLWYIEYLLGVAWHGAMIPMDSLKWKTAWKLRRIAEGKGLLVLQSNIDYDLGEVAKVMFDDIQVLELVASYLNEYEKE